MKWHSTLFCFRWCISIRKHPTKWKIGQHDHVTNIWWQCGMKYTYLYIYRLIIIFSRKHRWFNSGRSACIRNLHVKESISGSVFDYNCIGCTCPFPQKVMGMLVPRYHGWLLPKDYHCDDRREPNENPHNMLVGAKRTQSTSNCSSIL